MKITGIKTYFVQVPPPYDGGNTYHFIKITTDEGILGWGEMTISGSYRNMEKSLELEINEIFEQFLKSQDPFDREKLSKLMYSSLCCHHTDVSRMGIISGIDIALWDICGKACGRPVYDLMGGKCRDRLRTYSYICYPMINGKKNYWDLWHDSQAVADRAVEMMEQGFDALKYDPLMQRPSVKGELTVAPWQLGLEELDMAENSLAAIRKAVGRKCDILIGTHGQTTPSAAIRLAKRMEPYEPFWFEEPVPPENAREMARVAHQTSIPIATGERLATAHDFMVLMQEGAAAVIQPDIGCCGGITEFKKISAMAETYYVQVAPHVWNGPVIMAASIQMSFVIPNFSIQESIFTANEFYNEIVEESFLWKKGFIFPSEKPGIGIELNEKQLLKYSIN